jgi:hypothetical protein
VKSGKRTGVSTIPRDVGETQSGYKSLIQQVYSVYPVKRVNVPLNYVFILDVRFQEDLRFIC